MFRSIAIIFALCFATTSAQAALQGRAPATPGGTDYQAYYDTTLNITWLADANLAATNTFGVSGIVTGILAGSMDWNTGQNWIAAMNTANYLGVGNWRLPSADVNADNTIRDCRLVNALLCRDNEMGYMYWQNHVDVVSPSPFTNVTAYVGIGYYGSGTQYAPDISRRWILDFGSIFGNLVDTKSDTVHVWPVSPGDVVPLPPAAFLFPSALGLLAWARRKKATTNGPGYDARSSSAIAVLAS